MDTLKTSVVVVLLLAGLYCVYVVLNKPEQYPPDIAWEAGATDPALQIELGVPEMGEPGASSATPSLPTTAWGTAPQSTDAHAGHFAEPKGTAAPELPAGPGRGENALGNRHSLPIPEPTTPAAPAIAAPDLLSGGSSPAANANNPPPFEASSVSNGSSEMPALPSITSIANDLREPAIGSSGVDSPASRYGEANRYSDYSPLRETPAAEVASSGGTQAPTSSTQANVNDIANGGDISANGTTGLGESGFQSAMDSVHTKIEAEAWKDALIKLSALYNDPSLNADEISQVVDLLDPLAGKVIYSTEHLIEPAYRSQPGDNLKNIADRYQVPWQLLANINGIENPETLLAGRELKVVRGPFRAEVSLSKNELTLFVDKVYAGRFAIGVGNDPAPVPGQYQINDKQPGRTYYAGSGQTIPIDDPNNPYGRVWLDLGNNLCIHGSSPNGASPGQGCIALTARDAGDVFGILSKGSSVVISR